MGESSLLVLGWAGFVSGVLVTLVAMPGSKRFIEITRDRYPRYWVHNGRPWLNITPRPLRGDHERRRSDDPPDQPWPSFWWTYKTILRMPQELRGDRELASLRRSLAPLYWFGGACAVNDVVLWAWLIWRALRK